MWKCAPASPRTGQGGARVGRPLKHRLTTGRRLATVLATAFALWSIFCRGGRASIVLGVLVIVLPHVVGAPQPVSHEAAVPAGLAAQFVAVSLTGSLILWIIVSTVAGAVFERFGVGSDE